VKIVSIALFGGGDKYAQYFYAFVLGHLNLFPGRDGWSLRVHVDDEVAGSPIGEAIRRLQGRGLVEYRYMGMSLGAAGTLLLTKCMMWRCAPVFDADAEYVFCRDIDAAPMPRDRAACEQFIVSKAAVHTVHDNLAHAGIMGGLCGFYAPEFRKLTELCSLDDLYAFANKTDAEWALHGTDQVVLNKMTQNQKVTLLEHRFNGWTEGKPGPHRREASGYECVGFSTPMLDVGLSRWIDGHYLIAMADCLANHLGAAGYDYVAARQFWEKYGDQQIAKEVRDCEKSLA
jgi:hypothetical protein